MDFQLLTDLKELRDATRRVVDSLHKHISEFDHTGEISPVVEQTLLELGYYGLTIPEKYGGLGMGCLYTAVILEELARLPLCFYTSVRTNNGLGSRMLVKSGTEEQRQTWLPSIATGRTTTAIAMTEPDVGSDVASMQTTARRDQDVFHINGTKHFITNGHRARLITVFAKVEDGPEGITCLLIDTTATPGFHVRAVQRTMAGSPDVLAVLDFDDCIVPAANLIGSEGQAFKLAMNILNEGRLFVAATCLGMAQVALQNALGHSKTRTAFGKPIADFQAIQHSLADMATQIYAVRNMLYHACWLADTGANMHREAAMAKLFASEAAWSIIDRAVQIYGGMGYMKGVAVERLYRDIRVMRILEGTSEILRTLIARSLIRDGVE